MGCLAGLTPFGFPAIKFLKDTGLAQAFLPFRFAGFFSRFPTFPFGLYSTHCQIRRSDWAPCLYSEPMGASQSV